MTTPPEQFGSAELDTQCGRIRDQFQDSPKLQETLERLLNSTRAGVAVNAKTLAGELYPDQETTNAQQSVRKMVGMSRDRLGVHSYYGPSGAGAHDPIIVDLPEPPRGQGYLAKFHRRPLPERTRSGAALPDGVIEDEHLLNEIESKIAGTDIWVAAHDLSNVGDRTSGFSELVRDAVSANAMRGVNYTYIYPEGRPGGSRIETLQGCFGPDKPGKLRLCAVPEHSFQELTLVPCHFISFNPLSDNPVAYMQLPLTAAQKGWIELQEQSSLLVLTKMRQLVFEHEQISSNILEASVAGDYESPTGANHSITGLDRISYEATKLAASFEFFETDAKAFEYLVKRYTRDESLYQLRDTHSRAERTPPGYDYTALELGLRKFSERGGKSKFVFRSIVDDNYVRMIETVASEKANKGAIERYHVPAPILSFIILDYKGRQSEVLLGWGHLGSGTEGGVLRAC